MEVEEIYAVLQWSKGPACALWLSTRTSASFAQQERDEARKALETAAAAAPAEMANGKRGAAEEEDGAAVEEGPAKRVRRWTFVTSFRALWSGGVHVA